MQFCSSPNIEMAATKFTLKCLLILNCRRVVTHCVFKIVVRHGSPLLCVLYDLINSPYCALRFRKDGISYYLCRKNLCHSKFQHGEISFKTNCASRCRVCLLLSTLSQNITMQLQYFLFKKSSTSSRWPV